MNQSFKLVLDYDGVVFRNTRAMRVVNDRSNQFVNQKLRTCNTRRMMCGHAVNYLNAMGVSVDVEEYNEFVYGRLRWSEMYVDEEDRTPIVDVHLLNKFQNQKSILFSNAPRIWIDNTMDMIGIRPHTLFDDVYTSETAEQLKPNGEMYKTIEARYPDVDLLCIDTLSVNGLGQRWKTHCFKQEDSLYLRGVDMIMQYEVK